ncbi:MAG TPA: hypothetical protein VGD37_23135 [Kofleriaceae bacterium]
MRTLALLGLIVACHTPARPAAPDRAPAPAPAPVAARRSPEHASGFEYQVRSDFFDGLRGDTAALDRAVKVCEDALARQPDHAEALVWHGAGMMARARLAFGAGDRATGMKRYQQGLAEMDRAVALAPDQVGVRIPRGAVLLVVAAFVPEPEKSRLVARGVSDYEVTLARQAPRWSALTLHAREQLLYGLTDGYAVLGQADKAQATYQRMMADAAGSELLPRAKARAAGEPVDGAAPCGACHGR